MQEFKIQFIGESPLLLHSARYADPLDPLTKSHKVLTTKKKKTEEDHLAIAYSEFRGGLYTSSTGEIVMPSANLKACILSGAMMRRQGPAYKRGVLFVDVNVPLNFSGPRMIRDDNDVVHEDYYRRLFEAGFYDCRSVVVKGNRVMRYRPCFEEWDVTFSFLFDETMLDADDIVQSAQDAGDYCGLGDYRPAKGGTFGRFKIHVIEED